MYYFKCPRCGNREVFYRIDMPGVEMSGLGKFLFGVPESTFFRNRRRPDTQCGECAFAFERPGIPMGPVAALILWIGIPLLLGVSMGVCIALFALEDFTEIRELTMDLGGYGEDGMAWAIGVGTLMVFAAALALWFVFMVSVKRYRVRLARRVQLLPHDAPDFARGQSSTPVYLESVNDLLPRPGGPTRLRRGD